MNSFSSEINSTKFLAKCKTERAWDYKAGFYLVKDGRQFSAVFCLLLCSFVALFLLFKTCQFYKFQVLLMKYKVIDLTAMHSVQRLLRLVLGNYLGCGFHSMHEGEKIRHLIHKSHNQLLCARSFFSSYPMTALGNV
jgi:hypothetical protein